MFFFNQVYFLALTLDVTAEIFLLPLGGLTSRGLMTPIIEFGFNGSVFTIGSFCSIVLFCSLSF